MSNPYSGDPFRAVRVSGCLLLGVLFFFGCLAPLLFIDLVRQALGNLHLSPPAAMLVLLGLIFGSAINLPLYSIPRDYDLPVPMVEPVPGWSLSPRFERLRRETIVAVNVGGCLVPLLLSAWLLPHIFSGGPRVRGVLLCGVVLNTVACYRLARPVPGLGIALPFFLPAFVALLTTWLGLDGRDQEFHAPVAFVIGISGPLFGADVLHWRDFEKISAGMISIGGAGTWDGIVFSGLLAAFLV
jgi:uncharacterized membrane protein